MIRLIYSDAAERDLTDIAANIASDNAVAALRFVEGLRDHCLLLETLPFMGRPRTDIHPDVRSFPHSHTRFTIALLQIEGRSKSCGFGMADASRRQRPTCCADAHFTDLWPRYFPISPF